MAAQRCVYLEIVGGAGKPGHREKARIEPDKRGGSLALTSSMERLSQAVWSSTSQSVRACVHVCVCDGGRGGGGRRRRRTNDHELEENLAQGGEDADACGRA